MGLPALQIEDLPHYTYDDYQNWEGSWEIVRGIPFAMVPMPTIEHQDIAGRVYRHLSELLEDCPRCKVLLPVDWQISPDTVVQPDVLVVCGDSKNIKGQKLTIPPVLVFEVLSPATERKDRSLKYRLYESAGVRYYCIIDPKNRSAEIFKLGNHKYGKPKNEAEGTIPLDLGDCFIDLDFNKIFKF